MIAISDSAAGAIGTIRDDAFTAISVVSDSTGNALGKSYQKAIHAIGNSARRVGSVLRRQPDPEWVAEDVPTSANMHTTLPCRSGW